VLTRHTIGSTECGIENRFSVVGLDNVNFCLEIILLTLHVTKLYLNFCQTSSIDFDRDDELFATAGVSRRIKVFNFETVLSSLLLLSHQLVNCWKRRCSCSSEF